MKIEIIKVIKYCQKHVLFVTLSRQKICSLDFIGSDDGKECPSTPSNLDYSFHMIDFILVRMWDIFNSFDCFQLQFETQFFKRKCDLNMTTLLQIIVFLGVFFCFFFTNNAVRTDRSYFKSKFHYLFEVKKKISFHFMTLNPPLFHQQIQSLCLHLKTLR